MHIEFSILKDEDPREIWAAVKEKVMTLAATGMGSMVYSLSPEDSSDVQNLLCWRQQKLRV